MLHQRSEGFLPHGHVESRRLMRSAACQHIICGPGRRTSNTRRTMLHSSLLSPLAPPTPSLPLLPCLPVQTCVQNDHENDPMSRVGFTPVRPGRGEKLSAREVRLLRTPFASSTAPRPSTARPRGRVCSRGLQVAHTLFDDLSGCVLGFVHISSKFCLVAVITIAFSNASTGQ